MYKELNCPQSLLILPFTRKEILKNVLLIVPAPSELISARQFLLSSKVSIKLRVKVLKVHLKNDHLQKCPLEQRIALWCWLQPAVSPLGKGRPALRERREGSELSHQWNYRSPLRFLELQIYYVFRFFLKPSVPGGGCFSVRGECFCSPPVLMVEADCIWLLGYHLTAPWKENNLLPRKCRGSLLGIQEGIAKYWKLECLSAARQSGIVL